MDREVIYEALSGAAHDEDAVFARLRELPIDAVADVLHYVPSEYERLRRVLPRMASAEVQTNWTGASGFPLLLQSCAIARAMESGLNRFAGKSIDNLTILDFGCGWGRLIRLMYKFTDPSKIYGCDPWDKSLELCREAGLRANLAQSDYLPSTLPFSGVKFDFIYAFSVFTHLSERAAAAALAACRKSIAPDGVMMLTVRPASYWKYHSEVRPEQIDVAALERNHREKGFAFAPHRRETVDGDVTYGDTSITLQYIRDKWIDWEIIGTDILLQDSYQTLVFLRPVER